MATKNIIMNYKDIDEIKQMWMDGKFTVNKGDYGTIKKPDGYVFDENQTVKWNRDKLEEFNRNVSSETTRYYADSGKMQQKMRDMVVDFISGCYEIDRDIAVKIETFTWGMYYDNIQDNYFYYTDKIAEFCSDTFLK